MKNLLISTSIAALMASNSMVSFAGSVPTAIQFISGEKAIAADVNTNFNNITPAVNDNDSRINANGITASSDHENRIKANEDAIAGGGGCPAGEMVAVGPLCVDIYEASVWDAASSGTQLTTDTAITRCNADGSDCGKDASTATTTAIYALSLPLKTPNNRVTWYQAAQACANVGKRLPTTAEWQAAAAGTLPNAVDSSSPCNTGGTVTLTGSIATCKSNVGAFDMVGNLMEWSADLNIDYTTDTGPVLKGQFTDTDSSLVWALGESKANISTTASTKSIFILSNGPGAANGEVGFRCVK